MFCSPIGAETYKKEKTCFSHEALLRLAKVWNESGKGERIALRSSKSQLWKEINKRMTNECGSGQEWCWPDKLNAKSEVVEKSLRPVKPEEWYDNPDTWLSNFEIEDVMEQYEHDKANKYKFLGVYPIDFEAKTFFGKCLYEEICKLDIGKYYKKGVRYIGMITNLDKHDQSGSHWTSLFACIDPSAKNFGAYYYDSVARKPPGEVESFMRSLEAQAKMLPGGDKRKFKKCWNKKVHQRGNNECGMFSMHYQIRWLGELKKNKDVTFKQIVDIPLTDKHVHDERNKIFRPNVKVEQKRKNIKT